jgi:hypothetical protein
VGACPRTILVAFPQLGTWPEGRTGWTERLVRAAVAWTDWVCLMFGWTARVRGVVAWAGWLVRVDGPAGRLGLAERGWLPLDPPWERP